MKTKNEIFGAKMARESQQTVNFGNAVLGSSVKNSRISFYIRSLMNFFQADDEGLRRPLPSQPMQKPGGDDGGGPSKTEVNRPDTRQLRPHEAR